MSEAEASMGRGSHNHAAGSKAIPRWMGHAGAQLSLVLALGNWGQADLCEFTDSLVYTVSS